MAESQTQKLSQAALFHFLAPPHSSLEIPTPTLKERSELKSHLGPITHALLIPSCAPTTHHGAASTSRQYQTSPVNQQASPPSIISKFQQNRDAFAVAHLDTFTRRTPLSACRPAPIHKLVLYNYWAAHRVLCDSSDMIPRTTGVITESATYLEHTPFCKSNAHPPFLAPASLHAPCWLTDFIS
jgi:hypothetical protein